MRLWRRLLCFTSQECGHAPGCRVKLASNRIRRLCFRFFLLYNASMSRVILINNVAIVWWSTHTSWAAFIENWRMPQIYCKHLLRSVFVITFKHFPVSIRHQKLRWNATIPGKHSRQYLLWRENIAQPLCGRFCSCLCCTHWHHNRHINLELIKLVVNGNGACKQMHSTSGA